MTSKVALVTGASRGIGRGIALALAHEGYSMAVHYASRREAAEAVAEQVRMAGVEAEPLPSDIGDSEQREALVDAVLERFGRIDLLVNNAGVAPTARVDMLHTGEDSFDRLMRINLKGPFFLTQRVAKHMVELVSREPRAQPKIINIGSMSAYTASVNRAEYCISKAGVGMMTQLYAARLAEYGILVYEIRPGIIATDMTSSVQEKYDALIAGGLTPIARWGTPEDVARAVVAVARGLLPFSTGEVIHVDGGFHMQRL